MPLRRTLRAQSAPGFMDRMFLGACFGFYVLLIGSLLEAVHLSLG
ncbi:MAG: hypothetical protein ACHP84_13425 [Caulobacterales bacterium]|jgi:hypothetical protein